ncbi:hypothetical protein BBO99_00003486 [Phytophthora kernoviae]|uniref:SET domain-containing protein n=2 Tax=Phytophthora kernoviae TaxID=325452 RepID=A0A3R7K1W5_9STRA|nr:hypothetical protein G195_006990 [Phytophthora kernoviae 00238/432]KAG2528026.1 hypothetical protein JM16_003115 [Phytophthora kernoviae]KAG2529472.1 hypothetical protein JM18_002778 [Phytophthora kernoviae]RLN02766.1 hypothetical protein BBI17_003514 [Phytophthora kernoviae]RLN81702.1 hypothetical protein BBO99_00003486 [Phytophthora kernoviae]
MTPLQEWVTMHESNATVANEFIDPVATLASYGDDDRSIVARCELQPDLVLVALNSGTYLNGSDWLEQYSGDDKVKLQETMSAMQLSGTLRTTMALLAEYTRGEKSDFSGYIQQLPTDISLPLTWNAKYHEMLKHTTASPIIDDKLVLKMYSSYAEPLEKSFPTIWPSEVSTLERFMWAYSVVSSRAFKIAGEQEPTLLPVIDMANHAVENPAAHIVRADDGSFQLTTLRKVEKNEPVTISYGDLSNAQLLCRYGFVLSTRASSDSILITSAELTKAFTTCSMDSDDELQDEEEDTSIPHAVKGKGKAKANPAKRQKLNHPGSEDDDNSLFFLLHGDAEREFGLDEALLSFVMGAQLPAEQLYDVLVVILQEKDKRYSDVLEATATPPSSEVSAIQQLAKHERQVCRRILMGLMTLEEGSDSSDEED